MPAEFVLILCSCPDRDSANDISRALVEGRLAACVNQLPGMRSTYRWEDELRHAEEVLLLIKTQAKHFSQIERRIADLHPYELPEVIAVPVSDGSRPYLDWVACSITSPTSEPVT